MNAKAYFYEVKTKAMRANEKGVEKIKNEAILIDAISLSDVDAKCANITNLVDILGAKKSNICEFVASGLTGKWFNVSVGILTEKGKLNKSNYLVEAESTEEALELINNYASTWGCDYAICSIKGSLILDIIQ